MVPFTWLGLDTVNDLSDVPVDRILDVQNTVIDADIGRRNLPGGRCWGVVLAGTVLPRHPQQAVANGVAADGIPWEFSVVNSSS